MNPPQEPPTLRRLAEWAKITYDIDLLDIPAGDAQSHLDEGLTKAYRLATDDWEPWTTEAFAEAAVRYAETMFGEPPGTLLSSAAAPVADTTRPHPATGSQ